MDEQRGNKFQFSVREFGKAPPGFVLPLVLLAALPITFWAVRESHSSAIPPMIVAIFVVSAIWAAVAMIQVTRRARNLGWQRSHLTRLMLGSRPGDPEELLIWQWVLQTYYASLALALCVLALYLMS
jgi:hypothetical protein